MTTMTVPSLRHLERTSIRAFVESCSEYFSGRVLDYGCGKQPYRLIVETAGAEYLGYDRAGWPANVSGKDVGTGVVLHGGWDAVLSTQTIQYVSDPIGWLDSIRKFLKVGGHLVLTGPTNWPIVEPEDRWRFTPNGIASLLNNLGYFVVKVEQRASVSHEGENWLLGWGAVART